MHATHASCAVIMITGLRLWDTGEPVTVRAYGSATADRTICMSDAIVAPGLQDPHVHFRDPGIPEAETMLSGARAAAGGGYTNVLVMPNTIPATDGMPLDERSPLAMRMREAGMTGRVSVLDYLRNYSHITGSQLPVHYELCAAATTGRHGVTVNDPSHWASLAQEPHPVVALSDDGATIPGELLEPVARLAAAHNMVLIDHCEHHEHGVMNHGAASRTLGVEGIDPDTEIRIVERDIAMARQTGVRLHLQHVSTAGAIRLIRQAKQECLPVTCETAPHYLSLTDRDVIRLGTMAKMNPPLRGVDDQQALREAVADGTIDMIATDHAPHPASKKTYGLTQAANGIIGLETAYGVCHHTLVDTGIITNQQLIELMSVNPGILLNHPSTSPRTLMDDTGLIDLTDPKHGNAELSILAPDRQWTIHAANFASRARNTPFDHWQVTGQPVTTLINGHLTRMPRH